MTEHDHRWTVWIRSRLLHYDGTPRVTDKDPLQQQARRIPVYAPWLLDRPVEQWPEWVRRCIDCAAWEAADSTQGALPHSLRRQLNWPRHLWYWLFHRHVWSEKTQWTTHEGTGTSRHCYTCGYVSSGYRRFPIEGSGN